MSTIEQHLMEQMKTGLDVAGRTVYLVGEFDDALAYKAVVGLRKLDKTDGDITVVINSGGGSEHAGFAVYDAICECRNKVVIEGIGFVGSIAAAVFMAGDVRKMSPNAEFMIHNGSISTGDQESINQDAVIDLAEHIEKTNKRYHSILAAASKMSLSDVKKACEEETFYSAEETVKHGFADEIMQPKKRRNTKRSRRK